MWNIPNFWHVDLNLLKPGRWNKIHLWASFGPWATSWQPPVSPNFPSLHKPWENGGRVFLSSSTGLAPAIVPQVSHCCSFHLWIHNPRSLIFYKLTPPKNVIPSPSLYQLQFFFLHWAYNFDLTPPQGGLSSIRSRRDPICPHLLFSGFEEKFPSKCFRTSGSFSNCIITLWGLFIHTWVWTRLFPNGIHTRSRAPGNGAAFGNGIGGTRVCLAECVLSCCVVADSLRSRGL